MTSDLKKLPPFDSVLIDKNENGQFVLNMASDECGDVKIVLVSAVAIALFETLVNAMTLQLEIDKIPVEHREKFPLEMAANVVRGSGWFKAMGPQEMVAQQFNGIFGAASAQKDN